MPPATPADPAPKHPGVKFPPPFLFAGGLGLGYLVHRSWPLPWVPGGIPRFGLGWALVALGLALGAWGFITFLLARTAILPHHPASRLVYAGPYKFTRNPMYVGLTGVYLGVSTLIDSLWPMLLLPVVLGALYRWVIRREERYLAAEFGAAYDDYRRKVRRWL